MCEANPARGLLIVEDDDAYRHALERAALNYGFTPFGCASWSEIDQNLDYHPALAGAVLDLQLSPGTPNGLSVGQMIHLRNATLPLVFISAAPELGQFVPAELGPVLDKGIGLNGILRQFEGGTEPFAA